MSGFSGGQLPLWALNRRNRPPRGSSFLHELRLELHRTDAVDLAVDVVVAVDEADVLDLGADLHDR